MEKKREYGEVFVFIDVPDNVTDELYL